MRKTTAMRALPALFRALHLPEGRANILNDSSMKISTEGSQETTEAQAEQVEWRPFVPLINVDGSMNIGQQFAELQSQNAALKATVASAGRFINIIAGQSSNPELEKQEILLNPEIFAAEYLIAIRRSREFEQLKHDKEKAEEALAKASTCALPITSYEFKEREREAGGCKSLQVYPSLAPDASFEEMAFSGCVEALEWWDTDNIRSKAYGVRINISWREPMTREESDKLQAAINRCWQWIDAQKSTTGGESLCED
jgi:hypothetical protein